MPFDFHQRVFDRDGMPLEKKASQYQDRLARLFEQSPEGHSKNLLFFAFHQVQEQPGEVSRCPVKAGSLPRYRDLASKYGILCTAW